MNRPTEHRLRPFGREPRFGSLYHEYHRISVPYFSYSSEPLRRAAFDRYGPEYRLGRSSDRSKNRSRVLGPENIERMFDSSSDYEDARHKDALPFGKAMKKLRTVVKDAETIYSGVLKEYNADVQNIKNYTPDKILRQLWSLKLDSVSRIQDQTEDSNQHADYGNQDRDQDGNNVKKVHDSEDTLYEQLNQQIAQVVEALKQAHMSIVGEKSSTTVFKASERLKEKIDTTGRQILELFQRAKDGSQDCEALLDELNGLYTLLESNRKLYAVEKEGENAEGSMPS
ncbi:hypothetical protein SBOR_1462 [Sclerotinia borealis F-4128]|uniref:Uncharacterized protein n=1 Tax=Sclerotinia borealis (strain F-4128) TaxID=1432307 RepID=W9CU98_SCLBF|nr:hypothetical protein SBOR_1462 [Sclerotinia borealis F-4128]